MLNRKKMFRLALIICGVATASYAAETAALPAAPLESAPAAADTVDESSPEMDDAGSDGAAQLIIRGFGGVSFGYVTNYEYEQAKKDGDWDNANFALNLSYRATDTLTCYVQTALKTDDQNHTMALDYAFIDQRFSDQFQLRVGKLKTPFGLYTEIIDVGTLRPFINLPVSVYGSWGWVTKSFYGVAGAGIVPVSNQWLLNYSVWGGQLESFSYYDNWDNGFGLIEEYYVEDIMKDCFGVQLILEAPMHGIRFGIAAYTGNDDTYYTAVERDQIGRAHV